SAWERWGGPLPHQSSYHDLMGLLGKITQHVLGHAFREFTDRAFEPAFDELHRNTEERRANNNYVAEERESNRGYGSGYEQPAPIEDQIAFLRRVYPALGSADMEIVSRPLPAGAEGWFAVPRSDEGYCYETHDILFVESVDTMCDPSAERSD